MRRPAREQPEPALGRPETRLRRSSLKIHVCVSCCTCWDCSPAILLESLTVTDRLYPLLCSVFGSGPRIVARNRPEGNGDPVPSVNRDYCHGQNREFRLAELLAGSF